MFTKVVVYKEGSDEAVFTFTEEAAITAGETVSYTKEFALPEPWSGVYYGVLSAEYEAASSDLAYSGFEVNDEPVVTTTTTTTTTTTKPAPKTTTTTAKPSSPPKTGVDGIPAYLWMISILSMAGIIVLRRTGGNENE